MMKKQLGASNAQFAQAGASHTCKYIAMKDILAFVECGYL